MGKTRVLAGFVAAAVGLSGCWLQPRFDEGRSNWASGETTLTSATVAGLHPLWEAPVGPGVNAPVAIGGGLYVSSTSATAARIDAATGAVTWTHSFDESDPAPFLDDPAWFQNRVVIPFSIGRFGGVYELSASTGELLAGAPSSAAHADAAVADDVLATRRSSIAPPGDLGVFQVSWKYTAGILGPPSGSDYAIVGDRILWEQGASALGFSPACPRYPDPVPAFVGCAPDWTTSLPGTPAGGPAEVGTDGAVYADSTGRVTVLDPATGAVRWTADLGAPTAPGAAPAVASGEILVATSDGRLVALPAAGCGAATCAPLWAAPVGSTPAKAPAAGGDVAYIGTTTGDIVAFALGGCGAATCPPLKTVHTGSRITGGPVVHDGRLLAGTEDGRLVAYGL